MGKDGVKNLFYSIRLDLKTPFRINNYVFLFIALGALFSSPIVINDVFAINAAVINDPYANNLPDELKWQMVFLSSTSACSNYHYQMMYTYNDVAIQYLDLYELDAISYDPLCITEKKYLENYESPSDLDLIILVYDKYLGEKELHANQMGGLYTHDGIDKTQNHVIIICDCSNFDYSSPVWILSHELSHFILYYKDFEMSVIERLIHVNDVKYDQCLKESTSCKSSSIKMMAGPGNYEYSVMPIYQPAVGESKNETIVDTDNSPINSEISKIITDWWATGIISDAQFSNAIGHLVDDDLVLSPDNAAIILTDEPLENTMTWEQMMEEITPTYWDHEPKNDDDSMSYLSKIPRNMIPNDKNLNFGVPDWFKETASMWGQDLITDKEFKKNIEYLVKQGIIESHTSNVFQDVIPESVSLPKPAIQNTNTEKTNESLSQNHIPEESPVMPVEIVTEPEISPAEIVKEPEIPPIEIVTEPEISSVEKGSIHILSASINAIPDIDYRIMKNLEPAITSFDDGNINDTCNNLENFFIILEYLINSNNIEQTLGQSLIAEGELVKIELCT